MLLLQREVVCGGLEVAHGLLNANGCLGATDASRTDVSGQRMLRNRCLGTTDVFAMQKARGKRTEDKIAALGSRDGGGLS